MRVSFSKKLLGLEFILEMTVEIFRTELYTDDVNRDHVEGPWCLVWVCWSGEGSVGSFVGVGESGVGVWFVCSQKENVVKEGVVTCGAKSRGSLRFGRRGEGGVFLPV